MHDGVLRYTDTFVGVVYASNSAVCGAPIATRDARAPRRDATRATCATRRRRDDATRGVGRDDADDGARARRRARDGRGSRRGGGFGIVLGGGRAERARTRARGRARARGKGRARQEVLEEEEYAARLEAIIERDYFPDLRSNRLKAALLEATRRGDARAIAAVHREMNVERMRRVGSRGGVVGTPSIGGSGTTARGAEASWETETPQRAERF